LKKLWKLIIFFHIIFIEIILSVIEVILSKDPCKKCLVKSCCSDKCKERIYFETFILRGESLIYRKILVWFLAIYAPGIIIYLIISMFKNY